MDKLQSALRYAKLGYSVLPMNGKHPLIKFADRPALTTDQIKEYWTKYPTANIALRTTSFFVVDIDTKKAHGKDGMKSIKQLPSGVILPTRTQKTASGGYQMFYMKPQGSHLKQIVSLLPGVDIKAHPNNYVVVPPSTTNKGCYRWLNGKASMKRPSTLLLEMIANYQPQSTRKQHGSYHPGKKWTGKVLDNIVKGAPEGQRNDYLTRLCGQMIYAGADSETVWTLINYANQFNTPPLEDREVGKIVASVLKEELRK
ncbi:DNA primase [Lactobacillus reuteri]|uniref:bifunctional DNA primase/polymerase n=1 Tax=Limosilactobacillus reuteri TaxID=1598 RepID=UPI00128CE783|nr:bifunctional DNA primase/polymerase [Limosilactobacillus reuteri]MQB89677.1 DNA primase [Limosilactobacillus reuteri]